jgi:hypothetical protein
MNIRFIEVTNAYTINRDKMMLSVNGITGFFPNEKNPKKTILKHISHNNGGYEVWETPQEILKLIAQSKGI